jgi:hypothetical protein
MTEEWIKKEDRKTRRETDRETDLDFMSNHHESSGIHQEQLVRVMFATGSLGIMTLGHLNI